MPICVTMPDKQHKFQIKTAGKTGVADFSDARGGNTRARDRLSHFFCSYDDLFVLTGPAGPGKTQLVTELLQGLGPDVPTASFDGKQLSGHSLFQSTFNAFGLSDWSDDWEAVMNSLANRLRPHAHAFLLITNAHELERAAFEDIRRISYLRSGRGPLLQTILVGRDQLLEKVESCDMARLNQWQIERYCMSPRSLPEDQTRTDQTTADASPKEFIPVDDHPISGVNGDRFTPEAPVLVHTSEHHRTTERDTPILVEPAAPLYDVRNIHSQGNGALSGSAHLPSILPREDIVPERPPWQERLRRPLSAIAVLLVVLWGGYMLGQQQAGHPAGESIATPAAGGIAESMKRAAPAKDAGLAVTNPDPLPTQILPATSLSSSQEIAGTITENAKTGSSQVIIPFPVGASSKLDGADGQLNIETSDDATANERNSETSASAGDGPNVGKIAELLAAGQAAIQQNYLRTPYEKSAWKYFSQVLELEPGNAMATQGMEDIAARYALLTELALERGKYTTAQVYIDRGLGISADNKELLALDYKLQQALSAAKDTSEQVGRASAASEQVVTQSEQSPEPKGLAGFLKKIFTPRQPPTN